MRMHHFELVGKIVEYLVPYLGKDVTSIVKLYALPFNHYFLNEVIRFLDVDGIWNCCNWDHLDSLLINGPKPLFVAGYMIEKKEDLNNLLQNYMLATADDGIDKFIVRCDDNRKQDLGKYNINSAKPSVSRICSTGINAFHIFRALSFLLAEYEKMPGHCQHVVAHDTEIEKIIWEEEDEGNRVLTLYVKFNF